MSTDILVDIEVEPPTSNEGLTKSSSKTLIGNSDSESDFTSNKNRTIIANNISVVPTAGLQGKKENLTV